jgi:hypothetical protein
MCVVSPEFGTLPAKEKAHHRCHSTKKMEAKQQLISQFQGLTGTDADTSRYLLESNNWNVEVPSIGSISSIFRFSKERKLMILHD